MAASMRDVQLPSELCEAVENRFGQQFGKLEEILVYILQQLVSDDAERMDQEEQRLIEERLKDLGYI